MAHRGFIEYLVDFDEKTLSQVNVQNVLLQNGQVSKHAVDVFLVFGNLFFLIKNRIKRLDQKKSLKSK